MKKCICFLCALFFVVAAVCVITFAPKVKTTEVKTAKNHSSQWVIDSALKYCKDKYGFKVKVISYMGQGNLQRYGHYRCKS